ncbi:proton-coupled zinc antiporter SLC30A1-like isoform X2 [Engraulis encrasicolus]|uniref:proton-coupled zinc antiporter SLC30A1-like isoform X2 n=1 Tax=Engraulis encrasicolus TaxID=184585 RepID=UPI002FD4D194
MDGHVSLQQQQQQQQQQRRQQQQKRRRSRHIGLQRCMLGLTLLLLLMEVVVSRLCNCLINMVDSFHTVYVLLQLLLLHLQTRQPPLGSSSSSSLSSSSIAPPPSPPNSANPEGLLHHPGPDPGTITDPLTCEHSTNTNTNVNTSPSSSTCTSSSSLLSQPRVVARLQPFGALVSSLLVVSLCVSVMHEILHHVLHPHPIQHPLLAVGASVLSLLFNAAVLAYAWGHAAGATDLGTETSTTYSTKRTGCGMESYHPPTATCSLGCDRDEALPLAEPKAVEGQLNEVSQSQQSNALELEDGLSRVPECTGLLGNSGNSASLNDSHPSTPLRAPPSTTTVQRGRTGRLVSLLLRDLLCPSLALANALASLLLGTPNCHHHHPEPEREEPLHCSSVVYLDPGLSTVAVLALLAFAVPEVHRLGLLLLQSRPPQLSVVELKRRLVAVRGVAGVHELHVWQLNERCWVASVHVHVNVNGFGSGSSSSSGLGVLLIQVVEEVTETLCRAGVSVCTVQPEVLPESAGGGDTAEPPPGEPGGLGGDWPCSLACGKKCEKMLCCSPAAIQEDNRHYSL